MTDPLDVSDVPQTSTKQRVERGVILVAVVVFVFGWLLPQIIDYELVWEASPTSPDRSLVVLSLSRLARSRPRR